MRKQLGLVRDALALASQGAVPVRGMLCFVDADWPLIGGSFTVDGIHVLWPKKIAEHLTAQGDLDTDGVDRLLRRLADTFPPA